MVPHHTHSLQRVVAGMNAEIEAMMAANKAAMEESQEEADVSQEEMATRLVSDISHIRYIYKGRKSQADLFTKD